jgi:hypothetical protein
MKDQIEVGLRELKASSKRMKELLEWRKLQRQEEKRDAPPSFTLQDYTKRHMKIEGEFLSETVSDILLVPGGGMSFLSGFTPTPPH